MAWNKYHVRPQLQQTSANEQESPWDMRGKKSPEIDSLSTEVWQRTGYHPHVEMWHQHMASSALPPWTPQNVMTAVHEVQNYQNYGRVPIVPPSHPPLPTQLLLGQAGLRHGGRGVPQMHQQVCTFIVQNIPSRYTPRRLMEAFQRGGAGGINFLYLPFRYRQRRSSRYVFVNFRSVEQAALFRSRWDGRPLQQWERPLVFGIARTQGLEANMYLHAFGREREERAQPIVFFNDVEVTFDQAWRHLQQTLSPMDWAMVEREANNSRADMEDEEEGGGEGAEYTYDPGASVTSSTSGSRIVINL
ncbi:ML1 [Symbiodinium natans]|uniref:ML1 protein n=1 Tax=Symbiodinium natans TaxID=878477 RepID=A0A812QBS0_9DINO|nr:ML1 [Symbiodinium natans]